MIPAAEMAIRPSNPALDSALSTVPQPSSDLDAEIVLRVGEQRFHTSTLVDGSDFFAALFSGRWSTPQSGLLP